jgi:glutamyl-tRNA reductase
MGLAADRLEIGQLDARDLFGDLSGVRLLVIGLGDVGELMLQHFRQVGVAGAELTGPSRRTPQEAARLGVAHRALGDLPAALARADIVVSDTGLGRTMISAPVVRAALKARRYRPILVIDGAVPPDVDPEVERVEQAFLYRLEDIERLAMEGRRGREQAAEAARRILAEEAAQFRKRGAAREAVPALVALRRRFEEEREAVLAAHPNADAAEATRLLLQRLLHGPSTALRQLAEAGEAADFKDWVTVNRVLQRLFALEGGSDAASRGGDGDTTKGPVP